LEKEINFLKNYLVFGEIFYKKLIKLLLEWNKEYVKLDGKMNISYNIISSKYWTSSLNHKYIYLNDEIQQNLNIIKNNNPNLVFQYDLVHFKFK
jgi:hypothetical protein